MATATPDDVRLEIQTYLDDSILADVITRISREIDRMVSNPPSDGTDKRQDLEAVVAAYHIATTLDRSEEETGSGRSSVSYEESLIEELRARAKRLGAPDNLVGIGTTKPTANVRVLDARNTDQ